uniref:Uncharacterized protein n=1 Tax=Octopus bimaculoides TaxID=37653 RepID=A0A0L8G1A7_OCTBM
MWDTLHFPFYERKHHYPLSLSWHYFPGDAYGLSSHGSVSDNELAGGQLWCFKHCPESYIRFLAVLVK